VARSQDNSSGAWKALTLLLALNLLSYIDRYILAAVEPDIREAFFGANDPNALAKTGSLATAFLLSYMITAPIFGALADRFSRWAIIAFGAAAFSLASMGSGWAQAFGFLVLMRACVGVGEAAYGPAAPTILADLYPLERRGMIFAWFLAAIPVGSALGYVFGGAMSSSFGWRSPFHVAAIPGLLLAVVCLFFKDLRPPVKNAKPHAGLSEYLALFKIPSFVINMGAQAAMTFAIGGMSFWAPAYFTQDRGQVNLQQVNLIFGGITAVAGLLATLCGGWLADYFAKRTRSSYFIVSAVGMLIAFPCTVAMLVAPFPAAWILCFLAIFFLFFNIGPSNTAIANITSPRVRSSAFALNIFMIHALGDAISPPLIGAIADKSSLGVGFFVVSLMMFFSGLLWIFGVKYLARDEAAASNENL
jgi:MFS family permease